MMLTTDELNLAAELMGQVRELRGNLEQAQDYARKRELRAVATDWPRRHKALRKCVALLGDVQREIEQAFS